MEAAHTSDYRRQQKIRDATRAATRRERMLSSVRVGCTRPLLLRTLVSMCASPRPKSPLQRAAHEEQRLLGDSMKAAEAETCNAVVDVDNRVVVRLDGHCFSTYTKGFDRPYDMRIHRAMVGTATDLLERFGAATAYTESDEISLIWPPHMPDSPTSVPFNGRVQKLVSVFAGYASARFNAHMLREPFDESVPAQAILKARVDKCEAHFDARVFSLPSAEQLNAYMRWRATLDCRRNSISMLAQAHFHHTELHGVDAMTCIRMLEERKGVRWEETPPFFRFGTYVKKEEYWKPAFNRKLQQQVLARRTRAAPRSFALEEAAADEWLLARFWPPRPREEGRDTNEEPCS